jgi:hypothetical protein
LRRLLALAWLGLAACGSTGRANHDRPPAPINVAAAIHESGIEVSPWLFGAGPIVITVSNQSRKPQRVTFATAGREAGITRSTTPIAPQGTARLSVDVSPGSYRLSVPGASTRVRVGPSRPSAQNYLLQP